MVKDHSDSERGNPHWLEQEIALWVHPMKDRSDDLSHHERTLLRLNYILLLNSIKANYTKHQRPTITYFAVFWLCV